MSRDHRVEVLEWYLRRLRRYSPKTFLTQEKFQEFRVIFLFTKNGGTRRNLYRSKSQNLYQKQFFENELSRPFLDRNFCGWICLNVPRSTCGSLEVIPPTIAEIFTKNFFGLEKIPRILRYFLFTKMVARGATCAGQSHETSTKTNAILDNA